MPVAPWAFMLAGVSRVKVPARCQPGDHFAVLHPRTAVRIGMHVETVNTRWQAFQVRREQDAVLGGFDLNSPDRLRAAIGADFIHLDRLNRCRLGNTRESE